MRISQIEDFLLLGFGGEVEAGHRYRARTGQGREFRAIMYTVSP